MTKAPKLTSAELETLRSVLAHYVERLNSEMDKELLHIFKKLEQLNKEHNNETNRTRA